MTREELIAAALGARAAYPALAGSDVRKKALVKAAELMWERRDLIIAENQKDMRAAEASGMRPATLDRLRLDDKRIAAMRDGVLSVSALPDPLGTGEVKTLENGLLSLKVTVPMGVVCMIYEARPNVTSDACALCIKSGNAVMLRGGSEAYNSNRAIAAVFSDALSYAGVPDGCVYLVSDTDRETVGAVLGLDGYIDLLIPRGGAGLINYVSANSRVPVIKTGAGNCHVYVHRTADIQMAVNIIDNAKTSRPSVCNAAETLLCDEAIAEEFLPAAAVRLREHGTELRTCEKARALIGGAPATEDDYEREYNDYILAVKVVSGIDEAIAHINRYGTGHSEAIVTSSMDAAAKFEREIDAAAVYVNASTRFTDGGVFGLGAEIGISTQKLHVRGPFGIGALVTEKYIIRGNGQIRI